MTVLNLDMYICMCVCTGIHVSNEHQCMCVVHVGMCMGVCVDVSVWVHRGCVCAQVHMCVCAPVHVCVCVHVGPSLVSLCTCVCIRKVIE
jgi:hypothetical protein